MVKKEMNERILEESRKVKGKTKSFEDQKFCVDDDASDSLYPCCIRGSAALWFYYEDFWAKKKDKLLK